MQKLIVLLIVVATFLVGAAFSYFNPDPVALNYLAGTLQLPLGALLMAVVALTVCLMVLLGWVLSLPGRAERLRLRRRVERAEKELDKLRNLPLQDG